MNEAAQSFCSILSQQADEALFATATPTRVYLLLEYRGAWGKKALEESAIPDAVKAHLAGFAKSLPAAKLLLIKRHDSVPEQALRLFVADVHQQTLYEFPLRQYEDALALDLAAVLGDAPEYRANRCHDAFYFVCTNGRRDTCCARFGLPVYAALRSALQGDPAGQVWQVTHVGGHRFAPNVLALPRGLLYGRLQPQDAPALVEAQRQGRVLLERLRGNTAYSEAAQAAEYYLRLHTGEMNCHAFHLLDEQAEGESQWRVRFKAQASGETHILVVALEKGEAKVYESCTLDKAAAIKQYRLLSHKALP